MLIPDPNFSIPDPGSKIFRILNPAIRIKEFEYFNPQKLAGPQLLMAQLAAAMLMTPSAVAMCRWRIQLCQAAGAAS
jgi:hypothetical protein